MPHIVEIAIDAENLARELKQMRTWLDHVKFETIAFRQIPGANTYRVDFEGEQEARAFADAFAGRALNRAVLPARRPHAPANVDPIVSPLTSAAGLTLLLLVAGYANAPSALVCL